MARGPYVNLYYCRVDKMSPAIGGDIGLGGQGADPSLMFFCRGLGMSEGPLVNLYYCRVDKMSPAMGGQT